MFSPLSEFQLNSLLILKQHQKQERRKSLPLQVTCTFTSKLELAVSFFQSCYSIFSFVESLQALCHFQKPGKWITINKNRLIEAFSVSIKVESPFKEFNQFKKKWIFQTIWPLVAAQKNQVLKQKENSKPTYYLKVQNVNRKGTF